MQKLAEICVRRPVFATVIILLLTVIGGFSFFTLGVDRFPKIDIPTVSVSTTNPGAAPQEIETEITDIIEGVVNTVPGIDEMRSTSAQGRSNVTINFNLEKNPDLATQEVRDKISTVINRLPETADPPVVRKADPDSQPVLVYAISAPRSSIELTTPSMMSVISVSTSCGAAPGLLVCTETVGMSIFGKRSTPRV